MESSAFSKRLRELRAAKGLTQTKLARQLGVGTATVAMWETAQRKPPADMLLQLAAYFGVTLDYLLGADPLPPAAGETVFPVITAFAVGKDGLAAPAESAGEQSVPPSLLGAPASEYFVFGVRGGDMRPVFSDGDRVLVRKQTYIEDGAFAVACFPGHETGAVIKIAFGAEGDYMDFLPLAADASPLRVKGDDFGKIRVLGRVCWLFRPF